MEVKARGFGGQKMGVPKNPGGWHNGVFEPAEPARFSGDQPWNGF
jgi:hypothetical protein